MQEPHGGIRKVSPLPRPLWPCPSVQMFLTSVPQTPPTPRGYYPQRLLPLGHSAVQAGFTRRIHGTFGLESFLPLTWLQMREAATAPSTHAAQGSESQGLGRRVPRVCSNTADHPLVLWTR